MAHIRWLFTSTTFWGGMVIAGIGCGFLWLWGDEFWRWAGEALRFLEQEEALIRFVGWLGWAGPPALIAINALQIVVAPLPNYAIFVVAGLLYGPLWGSVYGIGGMLLGGVSAMLLTRRFGRPLAERMVGAERLARWDEMQATQSILSWTILFLAPVGDLPYFLAGLSHVGVSKVVLISALTRGPTIFLIASAASGATDLSWTELSLVILALVVIFGLLAYYQKPLLAWLDRRLPRRVGSAVVPGGRRMTGDGR